jgi:hypothetical protein
MMITIVLITLIFFFFPLLKAVLKQFGAGGYGDSDNLVTDEAELHQHQKLEKLYISTRAGKVCLVHLWPISNFLFSSV